MAISKIGSKALVDCSVAAVDIEDNSITSAKLAGSIANAKLANSSITVNGTSVSLGVSGSIPAVSWQSVITADGSTGTTAVAGNGYFIDTTSAAHTLTLPSSPSIGDTVAIKDYAGTFGTNNLTIARNSSNIQGVANDSLISTNRASLTLVYVDATKGWLYAVESNVADLEGPTFITATGGTITQSGNFQIHTFTGDGCFVVSSLSNCRPIDGPNNVDYLVVAGGGGGGGGFPSGGNPGGGGAGGYRTTFPSPGCNAGAFPISATTYPITVGAGGAAAPTGNPSPQGNNGSNSIFSSITSAGGGGGGAPGNNGSNGGSGGGGGYGCCGGTGNTPPVSPPQGNPGGASRAGSYPYGSGGGGGAGAAGSDWVPGGSGPGGAGSSNSITGSAVTYAGGGGGGTIPALCTAGGDGGSGGGGPGATSPRAGTSNTGGGGGGSNLGGSGGAGGKGIVIIRYKFQ